MEFPRDLKYTKEHEWVRVEGDLAHIGITDYAQDALGDVVFLELPEEGAELESGETLGVVESVKAVSDLYAPISGEVVEVNADLLDAPELANEHPYEEAWMVVIRMSDSDEIEELMDASEYKNYVKEIAEG